MNADGIRLLQVKGAVMRVRVPAVCAVILIVGSAANAAQEPPAVNSLAVRAIDLLWTGDIPGFRKLVDEHPGVVNMRGPDGSTPFMYAAVYGDAEMLKSLLDRGADPNHRNDVGATALMWAVEDGEMVRVLLDGGADVNARSVDGRSALTIASGQTRSGAIVQLLIDRGAQREAAPGPARQCRSLEIGRAVDSQRLMLGIGPRDGPATIAQMLLSLHAQNHKRDLRTDAMVRYLRLSQQLDGRWSADRKCSEPAQHARDIAQTALAVRAMQLYMPPQFDTAYEQVIARSLRFLSHADGDTNDDRAFRLMGLIWAGSTKYGVLPAKKELLSAQRDDGGWSESKESTVYATELALAALREAGVAPEEPAYKKAVQFLASAKAASGEGVAQSAPATRPTNVLLTRLHSR